MVRIGTTVLDRPRTRTGQAWSQDKAARLGRGSELARVLVGRLSREERIRLAMEMLEPESDPAQQTRQAEYEQIHQDALVNDFLDDSRNRGLAEGSLVSYRSVMKRFKAYQDENGLRVTDIGMPGLSSFLADLRRRGFASNTLPTTSRCCPASASTWPSGA